MVVVAAILSAAITEATIQEIMTESMITPDRVTDSISFIFLFYYKPTKIKRARFKLFISLWVSKRSIESY